MFFLERVRKSLSGCSSIGPQGSVKIMECSNFTKGVFLFLIYWYCWKHLTWSQMNLDFCFAVAAVCIKAFFCNKRPVSNHTSCTHLWQEVPGCWWKSVVSLLKSLELHQQQQQKTIKITIKFLEPEEKTGFVCCTETRANKEQMRYKEQHIE